MSTIGGILKEARNKRSISLEEVHSRIKIHPRMLQLLEEDKFEKLPSPVFVKSFLRSYAEFLEMNPEEIVRAYDTREHKEPTQMLYIPSAAERDKKNVFNFDKSLLVLPAIFLIVVVAGTGLFFTVKTAARHLKERKSITATTKASRSSKLAASSKAKLTKAEASSAEESKSSESAFNPKDWLRHTQLGNFPKIGKKDPLKLKIKAVDTVWLRVTCDGKVLFQSILKRGITEAWTASEHIEIWTGNASSMELSLNNYDLGSPGKGVTRKMLISREGVRIYQ